MTYIRPKDVDDVASVCFMRSVGSRFAYTCLPNENWTPRGSPVFCSVSRAEAAIHGKIPPRHLDGRVRVRRFVRFHGLRHPAELGPGAVGAFLTDLATRGELSASTQNQALAALLFLYRHVLGMELQEIGEFVHAKRPHRLPVVLSVGGSLGSWSAWRGCRG